MNINLLDQCCLHTAPAAAAAATKAVVLNVGSIVGSIGLPGQVAYCSSKFGMHGFSEACVATRRQPIGRVRSTPQHDTE